MAGYQLILERQLNQPIKVQPALPTHLKTLSDWPSRAGQEALQLVSYQLILERQLNQPIGELPALPTRFKTLSDWLIGRAGSSPIG